MTDVAAWNDDHPLVTFRISEGTLSAGLQSDARIAVNEQLALVEYLARLADWLEDDIEEGRDIH